MVRCPPPGREEHDCSREWKKSLCDGDVTRTSFRFSWSHFAQHKARVNCGIYLVLSNRIDCSRKGTCVAGDWQGQRVAAAFRRSRDGTRKTTLTGTVIESFSNLPDEDAPWSVQPWLKWPKPVATDTVPLCNRKLCKLESLYLGKYCTFV
jgi:hypothetical protein